MALIRSENDLDSVVSFIQKKETLSSEEKIVLENAIIQIVGHPELKSYFKEGNSILNEKEIIDEEGNVHRPDRMVVQGNNISIIDYKTGKPSKSNEIQIKQYGELLEKMGFVVENKILAYIDEKVTILSV